MHSRLVADRVDSSIRHEDRANSTLSMSVANDGMSVPVKTSFEVDWSKVKAVTYPTGGT